MNATQASVHSLFGTKVQYVVPLYQRRYVWDNVNWETLWKDILNQGKLVSVENRGHFVGPIITRSIIGQQDRFEIIDGEQRLITFQIIFCVIRDVCKSPSLCESKKNAETHIKNVDDDITMYKLYDESKEPFDPTYKFIPTDYDKLAFEKIVQGEYGQAIFTASGVEEARSQVFGEEKFNRSIVDAYDHFFREINGLEEVPNKISNLLETIKNNLELVQITPGSSQQAEKIFESVNATGRKLSEFDYLRNNLFLRASDEGNNFYKAYWRFENDDSYDWNNDRLASFLRAFLMAKLGPEALKNAPKLFDLYQEEIVSRGRDLKQEFKELKNYAEIYKKLENSDSDFGSRMQFYKDLSVYEEKENYNLGFSSQPSYKITVVQAFILYLQNELNRSPEEILKVLEILESYIARRLLVDTVDSDYTYQAIETLFVRVRNQDEEFTIENVVECLGDQKEWISNSEVINWFKGDEDQKRRDALGKASLFTDRYIFYRIENWKRKNTKEAPLSFTEFPTSRESVHTLKQLLDNTDVWRSLGNLTFCWGDRSRQRTDTFDDDKKFLKNYQNNKLILNQEICEKEEWNSEKIKDRERELFSIFFNIWKSEDSFISTRPWENIEDRYSDGSKVKGRVVRIAKGGVSVRLERGVEGFVEVSEMAWTRHIIPWEIVSKEDEIEAKVLKISEVEKSISLSIKQMKPNPLTKYEVSSVVPGEIVNLEHFGAFARLEEGVEGLIHISELAYRRVEHPEEVVSVGDQLDLKVIEVSLEEQRIRLSLKQAQPDPWEKVAEKYEVGSIVQGRIVNLEHFGAFARLEEGVEGLIHISELAYRRVEHPEEVVSVGDQLDLKVIEVSLEEQRIRLSLKQAQPDPWEKVAEKYEVGSIVQGRIVNLEHFGAFARLEEGVEGLIHISELAYRRVEHPEEVVSVGDQLDLKVIEVSLEEQRIRLSLKQAQPDPWEKVAEKYEVGSVVQGKIVKLTPFGVFAELEEGIEGLVHISEITWSRYKIDPLEIINKGDEIKAKVLEIWNAEKTILLSLKQMQPDPWEKVAEKYEVGSVVQGKIVKLTPFEVFAELEEGIEGLIHISELAYRSVEHPEEIVSVGEELDLKVIDISFEDRKIGMSLKQMKPDPWEKVAEKYEVGSIVQGRIVNLKHFGAFAELGGGVEGLIHISELAYRSVEHPAEVVSIGEELDLKVIDISLEDRKIGMSLKQMKPDPWVEIVNKYKVGSVVQGRIVKLTDFGAFAELGEDINGFINNSELANKLVKKPEEIVSIGDELDLEVIGLDPANQEIGLSLKAASFEKFTKNNNVGSIVQSKIVNIASFGVFAKLEEGLEGLIRISELADRRIEKPEEIVSVGEELDLKLIGLEPETMKISLSLKAAVKQSNKRQLPVNRRTRKSRSKTSVKGATTSLGTLLEAAIKTGRTNKPKG